MKRFLLIWIALFSIVPATRLLVAIDLNGDGMSDVWQQEYSVSSSEANDDCNGTGLSNIQKSLLGFDPCAPNLVFQLQQIPDPANNELRLRINSVLGKKYQMESGSDLMSSTWTAIGPIVVGTGSQIDVVTTVPSSMPVFFRARFVGDVDADGDALTAWEEQQLGTSDNNSDTDGDGVSDANEFENDTSPLDYYNGGIPRPVFLSRTRAVSKNKVGFPTFYISTPPRYFLRQVDTSSIEGGNPESQVGGVITTTVDPDNGGTTEERNGNPFDLSFAPWGVGWSYANNDTTEIQVEHTQDANEDFMGGTAGAYNDPPNLVVDFAATLTREIDRNNEYTTDLLISRTLAALPPLPAIDAPYDPIADDATFATLNVFANERTAYASHSEYQFKWYMSPSLPALKQVTWLETFVPKSGSPATTVRHWEGTANETPIYYLTPTVQGSYYITSFAAQTVVDGNRDGEISLNDPSIYGPDQTSENRPYRFWLNDDDDTELSYGEGGEPFPSEIEQVPPNQADYSKHQIVSKRNLEDFSRLWINLGGVESALTSGTVKIGLKWKTVDSGTPAINIYPSTDGDGSDSYLKETGAAASQIYGVFNDAIRDQNNNQTVDSSSTFVFRTDYWNGLNSNNGKKCFLFEGVSEGKGELEVLFLDSSGNKIGEGGSVWLDLKNIKKMYERAKAAPDGYSAPWNFATEQPPPISVGWTEDPNGYPFEQSPNEQQAVVLFVHGWNVNYNDAINAAETMLKRLSWQGFKGRFRSFYWPTLVGDTTFNTSEHRAWTYGPALKQYVDALPAGYARSVVAHSMGNVVVGSALHDGMSIDNYVLMQAALAAGCYDDSDGINSYPRFQNAESTRPTPDLANPDLGYRGYLSGVSGNLANFHNEFDFALATGTYLGAETNWEANEEVFKPDQTPILDRRYDYQPNAVQAERGRLVLNDTNPPSIIRFVIERFEMMSFVARPRSRAVGVLGQMQGISNDIDLQTFGFTSSRSDHSGEFNRNIQELQDFYRSLGINLRILPLQ